MGPPERQVGQWGVQRGPAFCCWSALRLKGTLLENLRRAPKAKGYAEHDGFFVIKGSDSVLNLFSWVPSPNTKKTPHLAQPGSRAQNLGLGQMWSLLVLLGSAASPKTAKNAHIWPKPRFSAQEPGLGSNVIFFGCFGAGIH